MEGAGLKFQITVMRKDGTLAQDVMFEQNGLTYEQLLELQQKVVLPASAAIQEITKTWGIQAAQAAAAAREAKAAPPIHGQGHLKGD